MWYWHKFHSSYFLSLQLFAEYIIRKKENEIYKNVILSEEESWELNIIPEDITKLGKGCFNEVFNIREIIIPGTFFFFGVTLLFMLFTKISLKN